MSQWHELRMREVEGYRGTPDNEEWVLAWNGREILQAQYDGNGWRGLNSMTELGITHWLELPKPPVE